MWNGGLFREAPAPNGLPGYIRIGHCPPGDLDGLKGVYHVDAVDIVTQWEVVAAVERISEAYLLPVIQMLLALRLGPHRAKIWLDRAKF